jgi:4-amino-4-deoxy-L-arabinose transferase-like glycosyltransferase
LTVWLVYQWGERWLGRWGGVAAAFFLTFSIFHVTSSHFITTDVPVGFFIMAALYFCARLAESGERRHYWLTGLFIGLAIGTKYSAYVILVPAGLAHLLAWKQRRTPLLTLSLVGMGLALAVSLFLTTPYALFDYPQFMADLRYEWEHHKVLGHIGSEGNSGQWLLRQLLTRSDRWLTISAVIGFALAVWRKHGPVLLVCSFLFVYFVTMSTNLVRFERFLVPMIPALALAAGYVFAEIARWRPQISPRFLLSMLLGLLLLEPVMAVGRLNHNLTQTDVRTIARGWVVENLPLNSRIAREAFTPNLDNEPYEVQTIGFLNQQTTVWYQENEFDYLVFAQARYGVLWRDPERYADLIARYERLWDDMDLVAEFVGPYVGRPDHVIRIYQVRP